MDMDWNWVIYSSLNLPDGTVQGPRSLRGVPTTVMCRNSLQDKNSFIKPNWFCYCQINIYFKKKNTYLTCFGTLHHHGSMTGLKIDLWLYILYGLWILHIYNLFTLDHFLEKEQSNQRRNKPTKWTALVLFAS